MTGNAHKQKMLPQTIVNICERGGIETDSKLIVAAKRRLLSQLQKLQFSGKTIFRCRPTFSLFIFVVLSSCGCAVCLVSSIATKAAMAFPKSFTIFKWGPSDQAIFKQMFSLNSVLQIVRVMILC